MRFFDDDDAEPDSLFVVATDRETNRHPYRRSPRLPRSIDGVILVVARFRFIRFAGFGFSGLEMVVLWFVDGG